MMMLNEVCGRRRPLSKHTLSVGRDDNGKIIAPRILPTEEAALLAWRVHVAFEEGTQTVVEPDTTGAINIPAAPFVP